jgi:cytochrome c-type biogenesis protein CcmH/NrfF
VTRLVATVALVVSLAAPAAAQEPKVELYDVEDEVMCVSCNIPLFIAESPQADRQRALIRGYIAEGLTKAQIKDRLVAEYGEDVLAVPEENDGIGLAATIVPIAVVVAFIALLAVLIPRWRRREPSPAAAATGPAVTDGEMARLDEDLKRLG